MNTANEWRLIAIALLVTFVISGFASQIGVLVGPIAADHSVDVASTASQFAYLTGGMFVGMILPFVILDHFTVRTVLITSYSLILLAVVGLVLKNDILGLSVFLAGVGTLLGISMCAGGAVVAQAFFEKKRQTVLVAQDATYNLAGAIFPITTSFLIVRGLSWTWGYVSVGLFLLVLIILALISNFDFESPEAHSSDSSIEWNSGIFSAGVCLFLFMLAQISLVTWLPQYAEQRFSIESGQSGEIVANIYLAALISALVAVYVVNKVNIAHFLYFVVTLGLICVILLIRADDGGSLFLIAYFFGMSVSATYNSLVAYGLLFVARPRHKNVTFLIFASGLGTALAPLLSGEAVKQYSDPSAAITLCAICYAGILVILSFNSVVGRQLNYSQHLSEPI